MNSTLTNVKLKEYINLLDNMVLSCERLTWIIDPNKITKEQKQFIETFMLTTRQNKDFIVNAVSNMVWTTKVTKKLLDEYTSSHMFIDECLEDLKSIFFGSNNEEFNKLTERFTHFA
jgi:hypothetical protein